MQDSWSMAISSITVSTHNFARSLAETCYSLNFQIVEPLDIFIGHYEQSNVNFLKESAKILESLFLQRGKFKKAKDRLAVLLGEKVTPKKEGIKERALQELKEQSQIQMAALNQFIAEYEPLYRMKIGSILQNEENHIDFLRRLFAKFTSITCELANNFIKGSEKPIKMLSEVNAEADVESEMPERHSFGLPIFRPPFLDDLIQSNRKGSDSSDASGSFGAFSSVESVVSDFENECQESFVLPEADDIFMRFTFKQVIEGATIEAHVKKRMAELLQYSDGREKFSLLLGSFQSIVEFERESSLQTLADIINNMLSIIEIYNK